MRQSHYSLLVPGTGCHKIAVAVEVLGEGETLIGGLWKHAEEPDDEAVESSPEACFRTDFAAFCEAGGVLEVCMNFEGRCLETM
jgi:hypothetical protein